LDQQFFHHDSEDGNILIFSSFFQYLTIFYKKIDLFDFLPSFNRQPCDDFWINDLSALLNDENKENIPPPMKLESIDNSTSSSIDNKIIIDLTCDE
jgi:hypothetical protein